MKIEIAEVNCDISGLEELAGYTIKEVISCSDYSGEGFCIIAYKKISGVRVYRDFKKEDGKYYISEQYIPVSEKKEIASQMSMEM